MAITSLGYIGIRSNRLDDWSSFSTGILGMQPVDRAGKVSAYRMDDKKQRLIVSDEPGDTLAYLGWEVDSPEDLDHYGAKLEQNGCAVEQGKRALCEQRCVSSLIRFNDPDGNRIELFHHLESSSAPFIPGRPVSGFNTGPYGMGHAVLHATNTEALLTFYVDVLDFKVSDYGLSPYPMYFFHVNGRHHSFAILGSGSTGFHHFMVEYGNLDDVGQGYDIAQLDQDRIAYTLGRHTNDYMTSYYANTPSGFFVESGWGGRIIDTDTWQAHETNCGPSFWGHERLYLNEQDRTTMREMRMQTAADGLQAPPVIECPWLYQTQKNR